MVHRQNGRTPPPLPELTLPDSGYTVQIRPLGSTTLQQIGETARKSIPAPVPPMNTVTDLDGKEQQEPNEADPDYLAAVAAYEQEVQNDAGQRLLNIMQAYAVVYEPDVEQVTAFRAGMQAGGVEIDGDDRAVWFWHFLLGSARDSQELVQALVRRSQPTEAAIQEKVTSFSGDVQEA